MQNLDPKVLQSYQRSDEGALQQQSPLSTSSTSTLSSSAPRPERAAFPFLVAVVLWFDLLSCASTGEAPRLDYQALLDDYQIKLEDVVGCQNWAMIAIGDLAVLDVWKTQARHDDSFRMEDLLFRSQSIRQRLEDGLATLESNDTVAASTQSNSVVHKVTRVFASAALVQLHTIVHGAFPGQSDMQVAIQRTIAALEQVQNYQDLRGLIWPICISGCMAEQHQQPAFEDLIEKVVGAPLQDFGNSTTTLRIMQHCWNMRLSRPDEQWNWQSTMSEMGICGLLV